MAALALVVTAMIAVPTYARVQYLSDGATQSSLATPYNGWALPTQGSCAADATKTKRSTCTALRYNFATSSACTTANVNYAWTSVCTDTTKTSAAACTGAGLLWNDFGGGAGSCAVTLEFNDRNAVQCTLLGGTWASACTGKWNGAPAIAGAVADRDGCLRCHTKVSEYRPEYEFGVESYLLHGHKNIIRPVLPPTPIYGPGDTVPIPVDGSGNALDWAAGKVTINSVQRDLVFFLNSWMAPLGSVYYKAPAKADGSPALSYSCARCHTTGWTSDATLQSAKEPEKSFIGLTWDGVTKPADNKLNLAGGISGDANKMASWDQYGITCNRCHGAAVDMDGTPTNGIYPPPTGMSNHHSSLTASTVATTAGSGYCSKPDFTTSAVCTTNGGTWIPFPVDGSGNPTATGCSVSGICSDLDPTHNTAALCPAGKTFVAVTDIIGCEDVAAYGKANNIPQYAAAKFTGNKPQKGMIITALCMNCHRNDSGGVPVELNNADGTYKGIQVGNNHNSGLVTFIGHAIGQEFLNSPHAKFTGQINQVATGKFLFGSPAGAYQSFFMNDGEAASTGNGCTGCHAIHNSKEPNSAGNLAATFSGSFLKEECTECHTKTQATTHHPGGQGTPFEGELAEACAACHMPNGAHLFRINTDPNYTLFPVAGLTGTVNAPAVADGTFANAVWVDIDQACGRCHGGGTVQATSAISGNTGATLTVADTAGFYVGGKTRIKAAGALEDDGVTRDDFIAQVKTITAGAPGTIVLAGTPALISVTGKILEQNFVINGAAYMTKAELADLAKGMHEDAPDVRFSLTTQALKVNVDASGTSCQGSVSNCNVFSWNWGDNTANGSGKTATHTYAAPGTKTITLTVTQYSAGTGSASRTFTVNGPGPTAAATCTFVGDTWTATLTDTSTAGGNPIRSVNVFWGDGSVVSTDKTAPFGPFVHQYRLPKALPGYVIKEKVVDAVGRQSTITVPCNAAPAYFQINGSVEAPAGTGLGTAIVQLFKGATAVPNEKPYRALYSDPAGAFTFLNLPPGSYRVVVSKKGFTFPGPIAAGVGPSRPVGAIVGTPVP